MPVKMPNYIDVPDDIFTERLVEKMTREDLITLLIVCRLTISSRRSHCTLNLRKISELSSLSEQKLLQSLYNLQRLDILTLHTNEVPHISLRFYEAQT